MNSFYTGFEKQAKGMSITKWFKNPKAGEAALKNTNRYKFGRLTLGVGAGLGAAGYLAHKALPQREDRGVRRSQSRPSNY